MQRTLALVFVLVLPLVACDRKRLGHNDIGTEIHVDQRSGVADTAARDVAVQQLLENFRRVHFATDSTELSDEAKAALSANAAILLAHPDLRVEIQGHADERGTVDYNLALGQRRAQRITDWLRASGVPTLRLSTVTFGEEQPLVAGRDERAWSQNRRAEFRITAGTASVVGTTE